MEGIPIMNRSHTRLAAALVLAVGVVLPATQTIATALGQKRKPTLVWLEFQDCAGNTESMIRTTHPTVEDIVLETLSWEYHETIMAGYGKRAEAALKRVQAAKAQTPHGSAARAHDHKGNKVQPAKQRNKLQKGR